MALGPGLIAELISAVRQNPDDQDATAAIARVLAEHAVADPSQSFILREALRQSRLIVEEREAELQALRRRATALDAIVGAVDDLNTAVARAIRHLGDTVIPAEPTKEIHQP